MVRGRWSTGSLARRFALHTVLLFTTMAAPFFLLEVWTASLTAVVAALGLELVWLTGLFVRDWGKPGPPAKISLLHILFGTSVPLAIFGLMCLLILEWVMWAYRPVTAGIWDAFMPALIAVAAVSIYPPILFLLLAPRLARDGDGDVSRFLKGVRARGFGWFQINWLSNTVGLAGMLGLLSLLIAPAMLHAIERWRDSDGVVTILELVAAYPFLPFVLLATAAMLALGQTLIGDSGADLSVARAYVDGAADEPCPGPGMRAGLTAIVASACIAAMLFIVYPLHLGASAKAMIDGLTAMDGTADAMAILWNTHEDDDWTGTEIIEALNRFGFWTPEMPKAGLGSLVADPTAAFPETCNVRVTAGTTERTAAGAVHPEVKYCIAVACAPPFTWRATPALLLLSSRESNARGWRKNWYADLSAEGRAAAPGGYCSAEGGLADSFQG